LYKEIVSIYEFDTSIVDEYLEKMIDDPILKKSDISKYIKYAEYLRNSNHKRLHELYSKKQSQNSHLSQV